MSRIDDLIQRLCPDGVEFRTISEVAQVSTGNSDRKDATPDGKYPFYVRSKSIQRSDTYEFDETAIVIPGEGGIGDIFHYVEGKYALHQRAYRIHFINQHISTKFAYYYFSVKFKEFILKKAVSATVISIRKPMIESFRVPVPPLSVQEEIVRILDSFTSLEAELEAELEARKNQYEYYRHDLLLNPIASGKAEWMTLGDLGQVRMCKRVMKNQTSSHGEVPFYKIGTFGNSPDSFISRRLFNDYKQRYSFPEKGDVLISAAGTIGRAIPYDGEDAYFQDSNIVWIANDEKRVMNKYLYYWYGITDWSTEGGTIKRLYNSNLRNTRILVPPFETQSRIVSILDSFDSLVHDLSSGLPAEIAARRQQYEFYRDRLLSFKELGV